MLFSKVCSLIWLYQCKTRRLTIVSHTILELIHQYGYLFFYFAFTLGPFGVPIPNEITIVTGAILSRTGVIDTWLTYFSILGGLITATTLFYFIGKIFGHKIQYKLTGHKHFQKAQQILLEKGNWAICIGMFLPVVRYFVPFLIGISGTHYRKFALYSYCTAMFWTITFFGAGTFFGRFILPYIS